MGHVLLIFDRHDRLTSLAFWKFSLSHVTERKVFILVTNMFTNLPAGRFFRKNYWQKVIADCEVKMNDSWDLRGK